MFGVVLGVTLSHLQTGCRYIYIISSPLAQKKASLFRAESLVFLMSDGQFPNLPARWQGCPLFNPPAYFIPASVMMLLPNSPHSEWQCVGCIPVQVIFTICPSPPREILLVAPTNSLLSASKMGFWRLQGRKLLALQWRTFAVNAVMVLIGPLWSPGSRIIQSYGWILPSTPASFLLLGGRDADGWRLLSPDWDAPDPPKSLIMNSPFSVTVNAFASIFKPTQGKERKN